MNAAALPPSALQDTGESMAVDDRELAQRALKMAKQALTLLAEMAAQQAQTQQDRGVKASTPAVGEADVVLSGDYGKKLEEVAVQLETSQEARRRQRQREARYPKGWERKRHYKRSRCEECGKLVSSNAFGRASHMRTHEKEREERKREQERARRRGTVLVAGDALSAGG
jgi:hypothetical protein